MPATERTAPIGGLPFFLRLLPNAVAFRDLALVVDRAPKITHLAV